MNAHLMTAVYLALMIAPFLAIAAAAPYVLVRYRRTRSVHVVRCANLYLLAFFALAAQFMTMLPFPTMESVLAMTNSGVQLIPFYCVADFIASSGVSASDWTRIFPALGGSVFLGVVFNVLMLMPVGFFLRALFPKLRSRYAVLVGFGLSLFFELTQLSGLFFIYPRPYRVFDVDDLIQNTLGLWLGFALEPLAARFLPSATEKRVVRQGGEVSLVTRLAADITDQSLVLLPTAAVGMCLQWLVPALGRMQGVEGLPVYFACYMAFMLLLGMVTYRSGGRTPGMRLAGLQLRSLRGGKLRLRDCMLRAVLLGLLLTMPLWIGYFIHVSAVQGGVRRILCVFVSAALTFAYVLYLLTLFLHVVTHGEPLPQDRVTGVHLGLDPTHRRSQSMGLHIGTLDEAGITPGVEAVLRILEAQGIDHRKALRVQFLTEGVLLDWMEHGLRGGPYDVHLTRSLFHRTVLVSAPGPEAPVRETDSYIDVLSGTRLSFDAYYTYGVNVFAIDVP